MGKNNESSNDVGLIETAFKKALQVFLPKLKAENLKADFFAVYQKEAEAYDKEFTKKHDEDLNTTLIFAGLFSAVTSAFIIDVQSNLQPNYTQETAVLLRALIVQLGNSTSAPDIPSSEWKAEPAVITVQAILYASLAASLFAAFLAMLGKQWLNHYMRRSGGSAVEKSRNRQKKATGMENWGFSLVMETLPLMLQAALLLFGCAISRYLWDINHVVAMVNLVFTAVGTLVYAILVVFASVSYACPYQTPLSFALHHLIALDAKSTRYIPRTLSKSQSLIAHCREFATRAMGPVPVHARSAQGDAEYEEERELRLQLDPEILFKGREEELRNYELEGPCVSWILETSTDPEVISSAIGWISEIDWHAGVGTLPSTRQLFDAFEACFDTYGHILPGMRDIALTTLKALVHVDTHCCIRGDSEAAAHISVHRLSVFSMFNLDEELEMTLDMFLYYLNDKLLGSSIPMFLPRNPGTMSFALSVSHLSWMCRIILKRTWLRNHSGGYIPSELFKFLQQSLSRRPPPPPSVIADCVLIAGLAIGTPFHVQDLSVLDKSKELPSIFVIVCKHLGHVAQNSSPRTVMQHISALQTLVSAARALSARPRSYDRSWLPVVQSLRDLLQMTGEVSPANDAWEITQLALILEHIVWPWGGISIERHNIEAIAGVLQQHLELHPLQRDENHDQVLVSAIIAFAGSFESSTQLTFWTDRIVTCFCSILESGCRPQVLKRALSTIIRNPAEEIAHELRTRVSSALSRFWLQLPSESHTDYISEYNDILNVFMAEGWHSFMIRDFWKVAEDIYRHEAIIDNDLFPTIIARISYNLVPHLNTFGNPDATRVWLKLAWGHYSHLVHGVLGQLLDSTEDLFSRCDQTVIAEFEGLPSAWMAFNSWASTGRSVWSEEQAWRCMSLVNAYLGAAWARECPSGKLFESTLAVYRVQGIAGLDWTVIKLWLTAAWTQVGLEVSREVEHATVDVLDVDGGVVDTWYDSLSRAQDELRRDVAFMGLAEGTVDYRDAWCSRLSRQLTVASRNLGVLEGILRGR